MSRYLFSFRVLKPQKATAYIEVISENLKEAVNKLHSVLGEKATSDLQYQVQGITENFDCPKCRPVIPECQYDV